MLDGKDLRVMIFGKVRIKLQPMLHLYLMGLNYSKLKIMYIYQTIIVYTCLSKLYNFYKLGSDLIGKKTIP